MAKILKWIQTLEAMEQFYLIFFEVVEQFYLSAICIINLKSEEL
jgi:hypothetical protein